MTLNIALLGRQPKCFLNFPFSECHFLSFIFSDVGFLVFSIIDVSFWLFFIKTHERRYWGGSVHAVHYKSRKSHLQVGRVSWPRDHQYAQIFGSLFCNVATLSRNVATFQRRDVSTSRHPFSPPLSRRDVKFQRHDIDFKCLCHVATWIYNVATSIFILSGTSRRE